MSDAIPVNRIKGVGEKTAALFGVCFFITLSIWRK